MTVVSDAVIFLVKIRQIDINSIGIGGGSIAALGSGNYLTVGPRSAGAVPGPCCYGRGGLEPKDILNTLSGDQFVTTLRQRRSH